MRQNFFYLVIFGFLKSFTWLHYKHFIIQIIRFVDCMTLNSIITMLFLVVWLFLFNVQSAYVAVKNNLQQSTLSIWKAAESTAQLKKGL